MEKPPLKAFMVTLSFANGQLIQNSVLEYSDAIATASAVHLVMSATGIREPLTGVAVLELSPEWLRTALTAIETGKPSGEVISLVPKPVAPCPIHNELLQHGQFGWFCGKCYAEANAPPPGPIGAGTDGLLWRRSYHDVVFPMGTKCPTCARDRKNAKEERELEAQQDHTRPMHGTCREHGLLLPCSLCGPSAA